MLTLTNRIDMRPGAVPLVIHLGQYDSDFSLVFELYSSAGNFTVESSTTAMIRGTKTDGNAYDADATIDISAKTVTVAGSEQMTAAKGRNVYELVLTKSGKVLSTANFILDVERAAMDADTIASESVLKELNAIIAGAETATEAAADAASAADRAEDAADSVSSASAQIATNTADISDLKADLSHIINGLTERQKQAFLNAFNHVAWDEDDPTGQTYIDALHASFYGVNVDSITVTFTQGNNPIFDSDSLDALRPLLTVVAHYSNGSSGVVTDYELSGALSSATSRITVAYEDATATFNVSVTMPTFDYKASRDGLLSAKSGIITDTNNSSMFSEKMSTGGNLKLQGTGTGNDYYQFKIGNNPTTGKWRMRTRVIFYNAPTGSVGGFRPNISNGESGLRVGTLKENNAVSLYAYVGNNTQNTQLVASGLQMGEPERWYDIELFIDSSVPIQRIKIDGETEFESASFAIAPKNNSMFMVGTGLIFIDTIQLYNQ